MEVPLECAIWRGQINSGTMSVFESVVEETAIQRLTIPEWA